MRDDVSGAISAQQPLRGLSVLELGCGFGLPGVWTLRRGCKRIVFQDLNADVLSSATVQHVVANEGADAMSRVRFVAGDWFDNRLVSLLKSAADDGNVNASASYYDLILSAETLYTPDLAKRLCALLCVFLRPKTGMAVVAAKRYYFGSTLGGGTSLFVDICKRSPFLSAKVDRVLEDGASNIREVVLIRRL